MIDKKIKNIIIEMYNANNHTIKEIAKLNKVSISTVNKVISNNSVETRYIKGIKPKQYYYKYQRKATDNRVKFTEEKIQEIAEDYYVNGLTLDEIKDKYKISQGSMQRIRNRYKGLYGEKSRRNRRYEKRDN